MKPPCLRRVSLAAGCVILLLCAATADATEYIVNDLASFTAAQTAALSGDAIIWKDGAYTNMSFSIVKNGITVRAETPGGVIFNGTSSCRIDGDSIGFSGCQYIQGDIGDNDLVVVGGNRCTITHCNFLAVSAHHYVVFSGGSQFNVLSYCNIEGKPMTYINSAVQVSTSPTVVGYHVIRYCSFKNFPGPGGDAGNEPIRLGVGEEKTNISRTVVEYCYFENVGLGDSESISLKCAENVCRYNTFNKNVGGMLVFRQGYRNVAYGNFFINGSGGIRLKAGDNDFVYNNYFATGTGEALRLDFEAAFPLDKVYILHNTFVECAPLKLTIAGPTNVVFANNIFKRSTGPIVDGTTSSITFTGNIIQGIFGIPLPAGNTVIDPQLALNADGYYGLSSTSPAINAADSSYPPIFDVANVDDDPSLMLDISGQSRPAGKTLKDVGCDEFATGGITNRPLAVSDVGPAYLRPTAVEEETTTPESFRLLQNYPNPFNGQTTIGYELPASSRVTVVVYNILGQRAATLVDETQDAGTHRVRWDARDAGGRPLPGGMYLCRMSAGSWYGVGKLVYVK